MIWSLLLTACTTDACLKQSIQWFEDKQDCIEFKVLHEELPKDGRWTFVNYQCELVTRIGDKIAT